MLLTNRDKLNTFEGYGIIDGSKEAMENLDYGRVSTKRVKKFLLLSDGLTMPTQDPDQECVKYPRLKQRDDKTGILIED